MDVLARTSDLNPNMRQLVVDSACPPRASRCHCARRLVDTVLGYQQQTQNASEQQLEALLDAQQPDSPGFPPP